MHQKYNFGLASHSGTGCINPRGRFKNVPQGLNRLRKNSDSQAKIGKCIPQGLKPTLICSTCGTTEVVPFRGAIYATSSSSPRLRGCSPARKSSAKVWAWSVLQLARRSMASLPALLTHYRVKFTRFEAALGLSARRCARSARTYRLARNLHLTMGKELHTQR